MVFKIFIFLDKFPYISHLLGYRQKHLDRLAVTDYERASTGPKQCPIDQRSSYSSGKVLSLISRRLEYPFRPSRNYISESIVDGIRELLNFKSDRAICNSDSGTVSRKVQFEIQKTRVIIRAASFVTNKFGGFRQRWNLLSQKIDIYGIFYIYKNFVSVV